MTRAALSDLRRHLEIYNCLHRREAEVVLALVHRLRAALANLIAELPHFPATAAAIARVVLEDTP